MARLTAARRRVRALPGRAKAALAAAVVLTVALVVGIVVVAVGGGDDDGGSGSASGTDLAQTSTTMATGDLDIEAPDGWQPIPMPQLGVGLAVPPGWESVLLSPEGLSALARADPSVTGFADAAHAAAAEGGVLYAAGEDAEGQISDLVLRAAPQTGVTDVATLESYVTSLATAAGQAGAAVEILEDADQPTVQTRYQVGAGDEVAEATQTAVLGPDGIVWVFTVTTDDPAIHDDLVEAIADTVTFSDP